MWEPETPDLSECRSVWLTSLESRVQEGDSLISIANDLSQVTSSKTLYGGDMMTTTKIMKAMAEKLAKDSQTFPDPQQREAIVTELLHGAVRTGSNLLDIAHMPSWHDLSYREQMLVATSLLIGLEENAFLVADAVMTEKTVIQSFKNILLSVRVLENRSIGLTEQFPTAAALKTWDGRLVSDGDWLELPRGALLDNSDKGLVRLVFVAFDRLEEILQPKGDPVENSAGVISNVTRVINSKIISASLGKGHHIQLSEPVRLTLKHIRTENVSNPSCVFWDYLMSSWSEEGCRVRSNNQTHTVCECEHLTNFAVLMDVHSTLLPQVHQAALQVITYVGCVISVVCLVLAILTFQLFRGLKSDRTTIHKNLCICLLLGELLFLAGIGRTDTPILCGVVAGLLHFFFLCAFAWMFLEGFQLYVMLIEVFEAEKSRVRWYYLFAYGAPLVVVAISSVVDPFSYGTEQYCWLRADNFFIFSFVGPVIAVILANLVFLAMAIFMMCRHASSAVAMKSKEHSRLASAKAWLRGAIVLVFLLGLTWTFGLLYLNEQTVVMAYIFTILNSLQGLFIFIFHCVQNEKVRKEYRKFVRRHSWLPKCLRCSKSSSNGSKERRSSLYTASNGNPSAPNTHSSSVGGGSDNAANSFLQQGWNSRSLRSSGKGLGNSTSNTVVVGQVTHMPAHTPIPVHGTTIENGGLGGSALGGPVLVNDMDPNGSVRTAASPLENRVSTLPYSRSNSRGHLPKSSSSWGSLHKNMSPKNYSREQLRHQHLEHVMSSPPNHYNGHHVHGHGHGPHDVIGHAEDVASAASAMGRMSSLRSGSSSRRAHSPWNHTYTEIRERERERERERAMRCGMDRGMDDPVYEEIERGGEVHASDFSDDDGRRQSDMSRQSSRSYGDHRPLIPYSPGAGTGTGATAPLRYVPSVPNQCDIARTVAVLDGDTVVCHLQPDHSLYPQRTLGPYNECYSLQ